MKNNYTIIWVDSWTSGSRNFSKVNKMFVCAESVEKIMKSDYGDRLQYIFEGHVPTLGEEILEENIKEL